MSAAAAAAFRASGGFAPVRLSGLAFGPGGCLVARVCFAGAARAAARAGAGAAGAEREGRAATLTVAAVAVLLLVSLEVGHARLGDGVHLLTAFFRRLDEILVFEGLQGGVDHARAGAVHTAGALFHLADDVVSVAGLFFEQVKDGELDVAASVVAAAGAAPPEGLVSIGVHS